MSSYELLSLIAVSLGGVYVAVRLAIRAEVQALELRMRERYVTHETCQARRTDCAHVRALEAQRKGVKA